MSTTTRIATLFYPLSRGVLCIIEVECPLQQGLRRHKNWLRQLMITIEVECPLQQGLRLIYFYKFFINCDSNLST